MDAHGGHYHTHGGQTARTLNENALSCGKLILAEQNSAIKLEREKATKRGLVAAKRQLGAHATFLKKNYKNGNQGGSGYFEATGHGQGPMTLGGQDDDGAFLSLLVTITVLLSLLLL
jgi:hypothetical protein